MKSHTFENGFRVIHEKSFHGSNAASIQVICDIGSIHESPDSRGSAHFIEHMCFKGTASHPTSFEISTMIDKTGSYINAFTSKRYTKYMIDTNTDSVLDYIKLIADMLLNSTFDKGEYTKEREVVREEMIQDADDAENAVLQNADTAIFAGSLYEYPVDDLIFHSGKNALAFDKIVEMYRTFYIPSRMILSVCSANSFAAICETVSKSFFVNKRDQIVACPKTLVLSLAPQTDVVYKITKAPINPIHICIGFRACSIYDNDRYVLKLLNRILSGSLSSRLFMILREDNGLTYSSYTDGEYFENAGSFIFYAECDATKIFVNGPTAGVFPLILKLINDLVKDGITKTELDISKSSYKGKLILSKENADSIASYNAKNMLFNIDNAPAYVNKYSANIRPITVADINTCIRKYFRRENMVVSVIGRSPPSQKMLEKYVDTIQSKSSMV